MPTISNRGSRMPSSPIRKLAPLAVQAKERGVKIYHLNIGQPDLPTPEKALEAVRSIDRKTLEYSPSQGFASLREKLAGYYKKFGIDLTPDDIIVTTGGSEAVLFSFLACLNPGDQIIVPEPAYANYMAFAVSAGAVIKTVTSKIENGFALPSVEEIEEQITDRTKAILICNPNNPTGYLYTPEEMDAIRKIVYKHDLFLFSDEVYREFDFSDRPYVSAMHLKKIEDNVVLIDSVSKRYSECGIRIGAIVTKNKELRKIIMKFCQARLSPPLLGQIAAEASIEGTETYSKEVFDEYLARRDFFMKGLNEIPGVFSPVPQGAFYTVAKLPVEDAEDFCRWCLTDFCYKDEKTPEGCTGETIMMAPAAGFYSTPGLGRDQVRLAYVLCREDLGRALLVLRKALEKYPG
ncbi:MAG: pyridoxal phosphate-dependent aminotransferase [Bacteroidales bacterium]|nr:pyridoxal phosphate-dependent aminotransferase [Bacteroidales bacterium]